jgi:hypothetical protein
MGYHQFLLENVTMWELSNMNVPVSGVLTLEMHHAFPAWICIPWAAGCVSQLLCQLAPRWGAQWEALVGDVVVVWQEGKSEVLLLFLSSGKIATGAPFTPWTAFCGHDYHDLSKWAQHLSLGTPPPPFSLQVWCLSSLLRLILGHFIPFY